jgi:hypothetical protein
MPEISFNPEALSVSIDPKNRDVRCSQGNSAFEPVMVFRPGIQAIIEGLRLTGVQGFPFLTNRPNK